MPEVAQGLVDFHHATPSSANDGSEGSSGPGRMLLRVFEALDRANMPYCVTHGYECYPQRVTSSDIDIIIPDAVRPSQLAALLHEGARAYGGGELVSRRGHYMVLASTNSDGSPCFLELDFRVYYDLGCLRIYTGKEVLESRRRYNQFWVPAPALEFGCYLARRIVKGYLNGMHGERLSRLYEQDRIGCQQQITRFWGGRRGALIASAACSHSWEPVCRLLVPLGIEIRAKAILRRPLGVLSNCLRRLGRRMRLACRPEGGLNVVFLGPDGAGKSSVITAVAHDMVGAFARTRHYSFPPALLTRLLGRPERPFTRPHELAPRSLINSIMRASCYWFVYYLLFYRAEVRLHLARSTLVLHDRHLVDALVDPKRYRYGGPMRLLRLIWWFVPKPHLVFLLDAPPEVLQGRKQEVPFIESARQRRAYRSLVESIANGHIIDAAQSLEQVVRAANEIILRCLAARTAHCLGDYGRGCGQREAAPAEADTQLSCASGHE